MDTRELFDQFESDEPEYGRAGEITDGQFDILLGVARVGVTHAASVAINMAAASGNPRLIEVLEAGTQRTEGSIRLAVVGSCRSLLERTVAIEPFWPYVSKSIPVLNRLKADPDDDVREYANRPLET